MSTINRAENSATPYRNDEIGNTQKPADVKQQTTINDQEHSSNSTNSEVPSYRANGKEISNRKNEIAAGGMSQQIALQNKLDKKTSQPVGNLHVGKHESATPMKAAPQTGNSNVTKKDRAADDAKLYELAGKLVKDVSYSEADGVIDTLDQLRKIKGDGTQWQMFIVDNYADLVTLLKPFGAREIEGGGPGMQQARSDNIDRALARWEKMKPAEREWARKNPDYYTNFSPKMDEWRAEQEAKRNDTTKVMEQLPDGTVYQGPRKDVHDARENAKNRINLEKIQNIKESGPLSLAGRVAGRAIDKVFDTNFEEGLAALGSLGDAALPAVAKARIKAAGQKSGAQNSRPPASTKSESEDRSVAKGNSDPWDRPSVVESNSSSSKRQSDAQRIPKRTTTREDEEILAEKNKVKVSNRRDRNAPEKGTAKNSNEVIETNSTKSKSDPVRASNTNRMSRPAHEIDKEIAELQKEQADVINNARTHLRGIRQGKPIRGVKGGLADQLKSLAEGGDEFAELLLRELEDVQRRLRNLHREKGVLKDNPE